MAVVTGAVLSRQEAADFLGISVDTLDIERATGRLAYIQRKSGCKVWITEQAIADYLKRATHMARPEKPVLRSTSNLYKR